MITPHPECESLYVATCGSFHGFKFFPILGKYVVQMLDGELDPELQKRWAWNREAADNLTAKWPSKELRDFT